MARFIEILDNFFYPGADYCWDDRRFREAIEKRLAPQMRILDLGAGSGFASLLNFKGSVERVCGVDLDPRVVTNPLLDEGKVADGGAIPYGDAEFDLVFSTNVLEHLPDPRAVFAEVSRVLKPGGVFLFKTPNKFHYMPLVAMLTPTWLHKQYNRLRGRPGTETFPTLYRANSRSRVRALATAAGLEVESLAVLEGRPEYMRLLWPTYLLGIAYERLVNAWARLEDVRIVMIGVIKRPSPEALRL